ncbi:hypothetical protein VD0004_g3787 [Verticillium dahliae]|nr:hypothetical protein VD0004_g3787 [Verticillium dahliae]PNH76892.1 hypothetical protein VD0001_g615 [Verticillium dahliae]
MCGRYALNLSPSQIRRMLQDENMPVDDAPPDEGDESPRQSYNFAPGYHGIVYRADTSARGAGYQQEDKHTSGQTQDDGLDAVSAHEKAAVRYKLQSMKWGLIPFWTKRNPDYGSMMKTINCRDDSLSTAGGMWSTMKARKRCIVLAQGFYEWLKHGKEKMPHHVKRTDGQLMCFAGLWDCVRYEDSDHDHYTYTIITTDSNKQLKFLHDRMPVILEPGSEDLKMWLDPGRHEWSGELQALLKPFTGKLDCYPVSKEVGKVGNNSPSFIIPIDSKENKSNIANFFANAEKKQKTTKASVERDAELNETDDHTASKAQVSPQKQPNIVMTADDGPKALPKRAASDDLEDEKPPMKTPVKSLPRPSRPSKISATSNKKGRVVQSDKQPNQKITRFFGNSA